MQRLLTRAVVAALLAMAALVVPSHVTPAARAATCSDDAGVTVIVDFHQLGGGATSWCDSGAGQRAQMLLAAHARLTYAGAGFVCRVDDLPSADVEHCDKTPPGNAYWSLWWTDGSSDWTYSTLGVGTLRIPAGGSVALSWQQGESDVPPSIAPHRTTQTASSPGPTAKPTKKRAAKPTKGPVSKPGSEPATGLGETSTSVTATAAATPTESATLAAGTPAPGTPTAGTSIPSTSPAAPTTGSAPEAGTTDLTAPIVDADDGGLPGWVGPAAIVLLVALAGGVTLWRKQRS